MTLNATLPQLFFSVALCAGLSASALGQPGQKTGVVSTTPRAVLRFVAGRPAHPFPLHSVKAERIEQPPKMPVISLTVGTNRCVLMLPLKPGEVICGFGERHDTWNARGIVFESWVTDSACRYDSSYFAVPFFISSKGYGVFVNCTGKVVFDCGAGKEDEMLITVPEPGVDVFIFRGTPQEIVEHYTELVGRPQRAPDWVFQPWLSRNSYMSADEINGVISKMKEHGLKAGAVVLECWAESLQSFTFETNRYPNPKKWIDRLHEQGYHVVLWETPSIWTSAATYPVAQSNGFLVLNPDGSELVIDWPTGTRKIDFRKPAARRWWQELHEPLVELGVDGFKTDGGERMPDPFFHNLHPYYYQASVLNAFKAKGKQGVTFARSGCPPCAGNSTFWGGDQRSEWQALRALVRAGLAAGICGFPLWGHDIGGYVSTPQKQLYIRWLQLGAFTPIMQLHGMTPREPWYFDNETINIAKRYFTLRENLQPYILAAANQAYTHGTPIMRPLAWHWPDSGKAWSVDDQFMFGDDLLVAPILEEFSRLPIPRRMLKTPDGMPGLKGEYFANADLKGAPIVVRTDKGVDFDWIAISPAKELPRDNFSVRWTGKFGPVSKTGDYTFFTESDDGVRLWLNDRLLIDNWHDHPLTVDSANARLEAGKTYSLRLEYYERTGQATCIFTWLRPGDPGRGMRTVWLPPGRWVDVWTGAVHTGPRTVLCAATLAEIPVFARAESYAKVKQFFPPLPGVGKGRQSENSKTTVTHSSR